MQNGGFLDNRKSNPVGLGLVIAGHAVVLTTIALAPPEAIQRIIYLPTLVASIKNEAPPPPPMPIPKAQAQPTARPTTVDPIIRNSDPAPLNFNQPVLPQQQPSLAPVRTDPVVLPATIDPAAMASFQPDYPPQLIRADIEGSATVRVLVGSDGRVKAVERVSATDPAFFEATKRQALRFWRFKAATSDGIAMESWRTMTVRFKIQG